MHELSVCLALMSQVNRIAAEHGARRVEKIVLMIGPLSGIEPALLKNAFPIASVSTVAEDAKLVIDHSPVRVRCTTCGAESEAAPNRLLCGSCGDFRTRLVSGDEMTLVSLELATSDGPGLPPDLATDAPGSETRGPPP
jgi:hydrogenase nickel incorporation protein HypA/HybF